MFGNAFGWPHLIVILLVVLLLFGATRLPALSRSLGQSMRIFRKEVKSMKDDDQAPAGTTSPTVADTSTTPRDDDAAHVTSVAESQNKPKS
ncbi:Sec-independent protein translocase subunit TatA [Cnuibacter sp. UC19_7]|uniref:Sec-independent protein translocase subunit TatA n=1 Tax=Cnuibacter sp. UC19_7 TaxID=3350166 RepID=UPI00366E76E0